MEKFNRSFFLLIAFTGLVDSVLQAQPSDNVFGLPTIYAVQTPKGICLQATATRFSVSNPLAGPIDLLSVAEVREELQLIDEQVAEIKNIYVGLQEKLDETFGYMTEKEMAEKRTEFQEFGLGMREDAKKQFEELLLPRQIERLSNHMLRRKADNDTFLKVLISDEVANQVKVTRNQKSELKKKDRGLEAEYAEKIRALQVEYRNRLIEDMEPSQEEAIKKLFGADFFQ